MDNSQRTNEEIALLAQKLYNGSIVKVRWNMAWNDLSAEIQSEWIGIAKIADQEISELRKQLPEGMQDCTIRFIECPVGHVRLTADNWKDNGCQFCQLKDLQSKLDEAEAANKGLLEQYTTAKNQFLEAQQALSLALQEVEKWKNCVHFEYPDGKDNADYRKENQRLLQSIEVLRNALKESRSLAKFVKDDDLIPVQISYQAEDLVRLIDKALEATSKESQ